MDNEDNKKLKPITMDSTGSDSTKYKENTAQQVMLLSALQQTSDPQKLKDMIGVRTVAEVYRTLDKMAIRREFHQALDKAGISFDFIIGGIKREAIAGDKSADRLKAFEILLKTLGLDKYDDTQQQANSSWEDKIVAALEHAPPLPDKEDVLSFPARAVSHVTGEYQVNEPEVPESMKQSEAEEREMSRTLLQNDHGIPRPQ